MRDWQEQYLAQVKEAAELTRISGAEEDGFDRFLAAQERLAFLREENNRLLSESLFPALDALFGMKEEELRELVAFAGALMDWKTNLDCGVYVAVHEALLNMYRVRRDRDAVIRELYSLGMGLYYLNRPILGVECPESDAMHFENEMVFTDAAAYFRYFDTIDNEDTQGYILRAMANISICSNSFRRRLQSGMKTIRIVSSPAYRALAPGLPWDTYLRRAHQQLSTLRSHLSDKEITREEVAAVMDSCYEVFRPEAGAEKPSLRWLWPYYSMEFQCGYVSAELTLDRLERMIASPKEDEWDVSGLYGNVTLPIQYGLMLEKDEKLRADPARRRFLNAAYGRMLHTLLTIPADRCDDTFYHALVMVVSDYFETDSVIPYREAAERLMRRFAGRLYFRSLLTGELLACMSRHIFRRDPGYFASLPVLCGAEDPGTRERILLRFAADCGLFHDFGLFKMNLERISQTRTLFAREDAMRRLHTVSGYQDLQKRESTALFADTARGHHSAYTGGGQDPSGYVRMDSSCRQITDLCALAADLTEGGREVRPWAKKVLEGDRNRFSPRAAAYLADGDLLDEMEKILHSGGRECFGRRME